MLSVTFDNLFEQGASTIETSMRGIQRTYDEVVWGIESPPSYVENKKNDKAARKNGDNVTSQRSAPKDQQYQHQHQHLPLVNKTNKHLFRTPSSSRGKKNNYTNNNSQNHHLQQYVQGTPTTEADDSWGESSTLSDHHSTLKDSSSSASESEIVTTRKRPTPNNQSSRGIRTWKYASGSKTLDHNINKMDMKTKTNTNTNTNSSLSNININIRSNSSSSKKQQQHRLQQKLESSKAAQSRSIDEIFGYNTKQTLTMTKTHSDQDVGLDFCILDVPSSTNNLSKRSLLIVQSIDRKGLFKTTDLGVGDAILSINGTSFQHKKTPPYGRKNGTRGISSIKPNLFQARALLNGRSRSVTIEYQKFGETNTSICSSTLAKQQQQAAAAAASIQPQLQFHNYSAIDFPLQHQEQGPTSKQLFASSSNPRRNSSTRVDFLGMLRTSKSSTPKNGKKGGKSRILPPSQEQEQLSDSEETLDDSDEDDEEPVETPPRISRLTRLKARTQQLRTNVGNKKAIDASKKKLSMFPGNRSHTGNTNKDKEYNTNNSHNYKGNDNDNQEAVAAVPLLGPKERLYSSSVLPYGSILNHGPEEQIKLLKERVNKADNCTKTSNKDESTRRTVTAQIFQQPKVAATAASSPARSTFSEYRVAACSPARSTRSARSESYLQDLRKGLSPTANAILADLSIGMTTNCHHLNNTDTTTGAQQQKDCNIGAAQQLPPTAVVPDGQQQRELIRINRKVFDKLHLRVESLKRSNMQLSNELANLKRKRDIGSEKLVEAQKQLEQGDAKEQIYVSQLSLVKSRLEISTIQSDKRHRELLESKQKSIADNDKVISNLSKRIDVLERANQRLVEQVKKVEAKRKDKQSSLQVQFDRLKMKFSAQSTLLDNVMTSNEELTSQNEAMEAELHAYSAAKANTGNNNAITNKPPRHDGTTTTTGMIFAEGSESELEHIKRDPILLAQAKELSSCKERNELLEDQVESLSNMLKKVKAETKAIPATTPGSKRPASDATASLLDVTLTSSGDEDQEHPQPSGFDPNLSVENPSDEEAFLSGGGRCLPLQATTKREECCHPTNTFQLEYQHEYDGGDDETVSTSNHSRNRRQNHADDSFESAGSLALMERILELETALQQSDLEPDESERFLVALQSRISKLTARGYAKVGSVDIDEPSGSGASI